MKAQYTLEEFQAWRVTLEGKEKERTEKMRLLNDEKTNIYKLQEKEERLLKNKKEKKDEQQRLENTKKHPALVTKKSEKQANYEFLYQKLYSLGDKLGEVRSKIKVKKEEKNSLDEKISLLKGRLVLSEQLLEKQQELKAIQTEIDQQISKRAEQEFVQLEQSTRKSTPLGKARSKNINTPSLLDKTSTETLSRLNQQLAEKNQEILNIRKKHDENSALLVSMDIQATAVVAELEEQSGVLSGEISGLDAELVARLAEINILNQQFYKISPAEIGAHHRRIIQNTNNAVINIEESQIGEAISNNSKEIKKIETELEENKINRELAREKEIEQEQAISALESAIKKLKATSPFFEKITTKKSKNSALFIKLQKSVEKEFTSFDKNVENIIHQTPEVRLFLMQIKEKIEAIKGHATRVGVSRSSEDECKEAETDCYIKKVLLPYIQLGGLLLKMHAQLIDEEGNVKNRNDTNFCVMLNELIKQHEWDKEDSFKECEKLLRELRMENDLVVGAAFHTKEQKQYEEAKAKLERAVTAFTLVNLMRDEKAKDRRKNLLEIADKLLKSINNNEGNAHQKTRTTIVYKMAELIEHCKDRKINIKKMEEILIDFEKLAKHQTHGKPSLSKKFAGAMLVLAGVVVMIALNAFGGWLGGGALILSGTGFFYSGRTTGQSRLLEKFESSLTAYRNYRRYGTCTPANFADTPHFGR